MKKILIAGYKDKTFNYETALRKLGANPITSLNVPFTEEYDGLLLPGGGDIDPLLFGQLNQGSHVIDTALDRIQLMILKDFIKEKKPILGICKGMQLINICFGGDIIQHLSTHEAHEYQDRDQAHDTHALEGFFLSHLYGTHFTVNSAHHQGCHAPGKGIEFIQHAHDGVVEGLVHSSLPIIGVQWHPERMCFNFNNKIANSTGTEIELANGNKILTYFLSL